MQSRVKGRDCGFSSACSARFPEPGFLPLWPGTARKSCHHLGSPCWPAISGICSEPCSGWARSAGAIGGSLGGYAGPPVDGGRRSEEHTSELQSLMRISYADFCLTKKKKQM